MTLIFDDFANTEVVNGTLSGWSPSPTLTNPSAVGFSTEFYRSAGRSLFIKATGGQNNILLKRSETEFWGFGAFMIPLGFQFDPDINKYISFFGFHEYVQSGTGYGFLQAQLWGDNLELVFKRELAVDGVSVDKEYFRPNIFIERGKWFTLKYHVVRHDTNGLLEVWKDGIKIVDWTGPTRYIQDLFDWMPMLHSGPQGTTQKTIYFDDVVLADAPFPTPTTYNVTIASTPIEVPVTINGAPVGSTPITVNVEEGSHKIEVPQEVNV